MATRDADAPGHLHLALIAERGRPACRGRAISDMRGNRVWKLRRMAAIELDVPCRAGPGHWSGAGAPVFRLGEEIAC